MLSKLSFIIGMIFTSLIVPCISTNKPFSNYCSQNNETKNIIQQDNTKCDDIVVYTVEAASDEYEGEMFFGLYSPYNVSCNWGSCSSNISASYNYMVFDDCIPRDLPEIYDSPSAGRSIRLIQEPYSSNKFIILLKKRDNNECTYRLSKGAVWTSGGILCTPPHLNLDWKESLMCPPKPASFFINETLAIIFGLSSVILILFIAGSVFVIRRRKRIKLQEAYDRLEASVPVQTDSYEHSGESFSLNSNTPYHKL